MGLNLRSGLRLDFLIIKMELPDPDQIFRMAEAYKKLYNNKPLKWAINKGIKYYMKSDGSSNPYAQSAQTSSYAFGSGQSPYNINNETEQCIPKQYSQQNSQPKSNFWDRFSLTFGLPIMPLVKLGVRWQMPSYLARYFVPLAASGVSALSLYVLYKQIRNMNKKKDTDEQPK